jgi:hypothetical protein
MAQPIKNTPEWYWSLSQEYILQADDEFEREDYRQSGEKAWGAVSTAVKSVAEQRGWLHTHHRSIGDALRELADEFADDVDEDQVKHWFSYIESLHTNFYEGELVDSDIVLGITDAKRLLTFLDSIRREPPRDILDRSNTKKTRWEALNGVRWDDAHS